MMASSSARHLFLAAFVAAALAVAVAPRSADAWGGGRFFFSKTTRAESPVVEPEKSDATAADTNSNAAPTAFSRPSTAGSGGRGYGLYGRPEENYPPDYFRRGVHRNPEKLTTTTTTADVPATTTAGTTAVEAAPRGRAPTTDVAATTAGTEEAGRGAGGGAGGDVEGVQPYPENGSGRGRPPWYYTGFRSGSRQREQGQEQEQRDYGMSDTRLYQNGRYYYDVDAGRYGYGRESNPMRTRARPDQEEFGSGYGRPGGRRGYGDSAGYYQQQPQQQQEQYGNEEEFGNGGMDDRNANGGGFQEEGQNGRYSP